MADGWMAIRRRGTGVLSDRKAQLAMPTIGYGSIPLFSGNVATFNGTGCSCMLAWPKLVGWVVRSCGATHSWVTSSDFHRPLLCQSHLFYDNLSTTQLFTFIYTRLSCCLRAVAHCSFLQRSCLIYTRRSVTHLKPTRSTRSTTTTYSSAFLGYLCNTPPDDTSSPRSCYSPCFPP